MASNLSRDWPVSILLGAVLFFFIYVVIKSNKQKEEDRKDHK